MNRVVTALAVSVLGGLLVQHSARGDMVSPGHRVVDREVRLTGLDEHPELVLVAYIGGPRFETYEAYVVEQDVALTTGRGGSHPRLFAVQKTAFDDAGGLTGIDFKALADTVDPAVIIPPRNYTVDADPLETEELYYRIQSAGAGSVTLALCRRVLKYSDSTPDRVETF
jgi:hypothetical protein